MPHNSECQGADRLRDWLLLTVTEGFGPVTVCALLAQIGLPDQILRADPAALSGIVGERLAKRLLAPDTRRDALVQRCLEWADQPGRHLITLVDPAYPTRLLTLTDPPPVLFVQGDSDRLSEPAIAVVGSRHASRSGEQHAEAFAQALAEAGWTITSGLAAGIDAAAHRGALAAGGGATIAVIGNGPDRIYPRRNTALARQIARSAVIVSELPPGAEPQRHHFPRRNRMIAALSVGVLVVEAAPQSGSLITARLAAETGREVFAIPGSIDAPLAKGCHALIKQGAKLVETIDDILSELEPGLVAKTRAAAQRRLAPTGATEPRPIAKVEAEAGAETEAGADALPPADEAAILDALGWDPLGPEHLAERCGLPAGRVAAGLLMLELNGRLERLTDGRYRRLAPRDAGPTAEARGGDWPAAVSFAGLSGNRAAGDTHG